MKFALKIPILSHWMFEKLIKFTTQIYTLNVYKANEYEVKIKIQKKRKKSNFRNHFLLKYRYMSLNVRALIAVFVLTSKECGEMETF